MFIKDYRSALVLEYNFVYDFRIFLGEKAFLLCMCVLCGNGLIVIPSHWLPLIRCRQKKPRTSRSGPHIFHPLFLVCIFLVLVCVCVGLSLGSTAPTNPTYEDESTDGSSCGNSLDFH